MPYSGKPSDIHLNIYQICEPVPEALSFDISEITLNKRNI
jgi:hypothetical protein